MDKLTYSITKQDNLDEMHSLINKCIPCTIIEKNININNSLNSIEEVSIFINYIRAVFVYGDFDKLTIEIQCVKIPLTVETLLLHNSYYKQSKQVC